MYEHYFSLTSVRIISWCSFIKMLYRDACIRFSFLFSFQYSAHVQGLWMFHSREKKEKTKNSNCNSDLMRMFAKCLFKRLFCLISDNRRAIFRGISTKLSCFYCRVSKEFVVYDCCSFAQFRSHIANSKLKWTKFCFAIGIAKVI